MCFYCPADDAIQLPPTCGLSPLPGGGGVEGVTRRKGCVNAAGAAPLRACVDSSLAAAGDGGVSVAAAAEPARATARPWGARSTTDVGLRC